MMLRIGKRKNLPNKIYPPSSHNVFKMVWTFADNPAKPNNKAFFFAKATENVLRSLMRRRTLWRSKVNSLTGFIPLEINKSLSNNNGNTSAGRIKRGRFLSLTGFTFVELLLVVIILGIVVGLASPNFRNTFSNLELSNTANNLASIMRYCSMRATMERTNFRINFDYQRTKYWITKSTNSESVDEFVRLKARFGKTTVLPQGIYLESNLDNINFYPDGSIDSAIIYLHNKREKFYTILTYAQTGYVYLLDYKAE